MVAVLKAADMQVALLIVCLLFEHGISMQEYKTRFCGTKAIHSKPAHVTQPLNASRVTTGLLQVLTLSATDCGPPKQMPSDIIVASLIIAGGVVGSTLYATRDRSIQFGGTAHFGREQELIKKLDEIHRRLKKLDETHRSVKK